MDNILRKISMEEMDKVITELYSHKNTMSIGGFTEGFYQTFNN